MTGDSVRKEGFTFDIVCCCTELGLHLGNDVLDDCIVGGGIADNFSGGSDSNEGGDGDTADPLASLTILPSYNSSSHTTYN